MTSHKRHLAVTSRLQKERRSVADHVTTGKSARYDRISIAIGVFVTAAAGCLYWGSCARDIVVGDTPEYITAAITLSMCPISALSWQAT
jgi:hypothetical protein